MSVSQVKIAYVGSRGGTSIHRANALRRLGHEVTQYDPADFTSKSRWVSKLHWETGGLLIGSKVGQQVLESMGTMNFDVLWVDHGRFLDMEFVLACKSRGMRTLNLNIDDPFGRRDRYSWLLFRKTVPHYDLIVVFRETNVHEAKEYGAKNVQRIFMCADEVAHAPRQIDPIEQRKHASDVLFVGTWMPGRDLFLKQLIDRGIHLAIVGDRWNSSREWTNLIPFWRSPGAYEDDEYATWIQCAKICVGLLSEGNRDMHTTRSTEIPMIGSLLCAQRTPEHLAMYEEGKEAVFWMDANECAEQCLRLLADEPKRKEIALAGQKRALNSNNLNEPTLQQVLDRVMSL